MEGGGRVTDGTGIRTLKEGRRKRGTKPKKQKKNNTVKGTKTTAKTTTPTTPTPRTTPIVNTNAEQNLRRTKKKKKKKLIQSGYLTPNQPRRPYKGETQFVFVQLSPFTDWIVKGS